MNIANVTKWAMLIATWITMGVILLFVLSILSGIVFIAKTALQTILSPIIYIFNLVTGTRK